ncbi:MAG TPA: DUF6036 family nucleotidyltransferase [archaeon]|nr:DUF6036 family nucleotidyltransferase [archaeon]
MQFENKQLFGFLEEIDKILTQKIRLTAVGGTAMTLLKLKNSTIDIDFDVSSEQAPAFEKALKTLNHGFRVDIFKNGLIFSQQLPNDYQQKSIPIKRNFKKISLFTLRPIDIVATKIGRLNERDKEDIRDCIKKFHLTKKQIKKRAKQIGYIGREQNYQINLEYALKEFFKKAND